MTRGRIGVGVPRRGRGHGRTTPGSVSGGGGLDPDPGGHPSHARRTRPCPRPSVPRPGPAAAGPAVPPPKRWSRSSPTSAPRCRSSPASPASASGPFARRTDTSASTTNLGSPPASPSRTWWRASRSARRRRGVRLRDRPRGASERPAQPRRGLRPALLARPVERGQGEARGARRADRARPAGTAGPWACRPRWSWSPSSRPCGARSTGVASTGGCWRGSEDARRTRRPGPCGPGSRPRPQPDISRNSARCVAARSSTASRVRTNSSSRASTSRSRSPRSVWQGTSARTSWRSPSRS